MSEAASDQSEQPLQNRYIQPTAFQVAKSLELLENGEQGRKVSKIEEASAMILSKHQIVTFKGKPFIWVDSEDSFPGYRRLTTERFKRIAYPEAGGVPRGKIGDIFELTVTAANDLTPNRHLVNFGLSVADGMQLTQFTGDAFFAKSNKRKVWNTRTLEWEYSTDDSLCVYRSPYPEVVPDGSEPLPFIMDLAGGDTALYDDIMQSIAPIIMDKKPDGVIWWVGAGANGKSTLMDVLYKIFPGQLASLNVKRLVDGRDTPALNGRLANIVKESSEGRIEDTEIYKCLGTHEDFNTHKFHSQEPLVIDGNIHSVFSGNSIPVFADKGHSIRRRTFIIPFNQVFESDPDFEDRTFTPEFYGRFVHEITRYARRLRDQGYRYVWSAATTGAKTLYDREASNAEEYARKLVNEDKVVAFTDYRQLKIDYENWCAEEGFAMLGLNNLRKAMAIVGFDRVSTRGGTGHIYRLETVDGNEELQALGLSRPGLFALSGYTPEAEEEETLKQTSILNHKW